MSTMWQEAPFPDELADLVERTDYRPGWQLSLVRDLDRDKADGRVVGRGLTLVITTKGYDSYNPDRGETYRVNHYFIVPAATYNRRSWQRWLFDQLVLVETHEAMEFFRVDGERPYAPHHGPGESPYVVHQHGTDLDVRTRYTGEVLA